MSHTITAKLNKAARQHVSDKGVTFFVSLGEKNYNYKTKQAEWTNYEAALFANSDQVEYYSANLVEGAVISVTGSGLLVEVDQGGQYAPRLNIQDAKLGVAYRPENAPAPQQNMNQEPQHPAQGPDFDPNADIPFANPYKFYEHIV